MPRTAARIFLKVTSVKVERVQEISIADCISEGITLPDYAEQAIKDIRHPDPYEIFMNLWQSINGVESWINNEWVWVYSFDVLEIKS